MHEKQHGQAWALDYLYRKVETPYLFHCEDDWEFTKSGYIERSLDILNSRPDVVVIGMVKDEMFQGIGAVGKCHKTQSGTCYYEHPRWRIDDKHAWWNGWIGSPNLKRTADYKQLGAFQDVESEVAFDRKFALSGLQSVWLEDQYARHIGGEEQSIYLAGDMTGRTWTSSPYYRFHLLGLAHVPTHKDVSMCAYTQKVVKLSKMLMALGHEVYFYGGEGSSVECTEFIQVISDAERREAYGDYDWHTEFFKHDGKDAAYTRFSENAIREINLRKRPHDFLLITMGNYQQPIAEAVGLTTVESGIGYRGVFAKYRVFESYAWMQYLYGWMNMMDGSWYDCVIPNYFDPADFPFQAEKQDYYLFLARITKRKGLDIAVQVTRELGAKLIVAGQGSLHNPVEQLDIRDPHVEYVGSVGPERRAELLGHAKGLFSATYYIEPFGGVAVEAQMCGCPVITSDWGAYSETVLPQVTGFRCRTFGEFLWAAEHIDQIDPAACRDWAIKNYSMARCGEQYQAFFDQVYDLWDKGWYSKRHTGISRYERYARRR